jgi:hypothetical protein
MRLIPASAIALALAVAIPAARPIAFQGMDPDRVVPNGGIFVTGWQGKIDKASVAAGRTLNDSRVAPDGDGIKLTIGPAAVYWNPANTASGDYTVSAKFVEPKFMSANSHAHPYGIFIGGHQMGTDQMSLVYCTAYGDGRVLVRGFSPQAGPANGPPTGVFTPARAAANAAVAKAAADGSVTQNILWSVKGDSASCSVNGTVVATYSKADLVGPGKLEGFDGVYGIRISHNLDVVESGLAMKKQ